MKLIKFSIIFELHSENRPKASLYIVTLIPSLSLHLIWEFLRGGGRVNRVKVRGSVSKQNGRV